MYLNRGYGPPHGITENLEGIDFGFITACLIHRVIRCKGHRGA